MDIRAAFLTQAEACAGLGSPFTAGLCTLFADKLDVKTKIGALCHAWTGDVGPSGDSVPLRLCGGMHALVLTGRAPDLAAHYPPASEDVPDWPVVKAALVDQEDFLLDWMKSPPQTNEVARSSMIYPGLLEIVNRFGLPVRLLEIGASGGLNLQLDRFDFVFAGKAYGPDSSELLLSPSWNGPTPTANTVVVEHRDGCDINPLDPTDEEDALRLRAYLWPDQTDRIARLNHALDFARAYPVPIKDCDAVAFMETELAKRPDGVCTVFYSTIAWQYLLDEDKVRGEALMAEAAASTTGERPLAWLRFEADGQSPGAAIRLQAWDGGEPLDAVLGRADFHGRWVDWVGL